MKNFTKAIESLPHKKVNLLGDSNSSNRYNINKKILNK